MFVVSVVTVNAIPHSCGQQNQHFVDRLRHPSARFQEIFLNRQFCNPKRLSARRKKADPHNLKIFVGLIAMPTHPIEIAFSGESWYITSKNNVDNCRAFCRCNQRNADFVDCRNGRRFCFNDKMLISFSTIPTPAYPAAVPAPRR